MDFTHMKCYRTELNIPWTYHKLFSKFIKYLKTVYKFNKVNFEKIICFHNRDDDTVVFQIRKNDRDKIFKRVFGRNVIEIYPNKIEEGFIIYLSLLFKDFMHQRINICKPSGYDNDSIILKMDSRDKKLYTFTVNDFKTVFNIMNPNNYDSLNSYFIKG